MESERENTEKIVENLNHKTADFEREIERKFVNLIVEIVVKATLKEIGESYEKGD